MRVPTPVPAHPSERLFELAVDAMLVCRMDGAVCAANPAAGRLSGCDPGALIGRGLPSLVAPRDRRRVRALLALAAGERAPQAGELRLRVHHREGQHLWAQIRVAIDREAGLIYVVAREAHSAVLAEQELLAARTRLAEVEQLAALGSWEWIVHEDRVSWSDELARIHGHRPATTDRAWDLHLEGVHPEDRERLARAVGQVLADGDAANLEHRIVRPDGEIRTVSARVEVVAEAGGHPILVRGSCRDVTETRRVADAQRAAEQLFRRAFDDAPIGMALVDLDGRWLRINRSLAAMTGRTEVELRATTLRGLAHPEDADLTAPFDHELASGRRRSYAVEQRWMRGDADVMRVLVHASLLHGDGDRPMNILIQAIDLGGTPRLEIRRTPRSGRPVRTLRVVEPAG
ncbi:unannotated protein [freshwater metagenome]|uniref:histidine kinase n=1 Tax=freshwater metagenome TaxID=449393 RepID=A0A6J7DHE1_9ZZZZ